MGYYAGLVLLLVVHPLKFCSGTGNIGCLFSENLCNPEKEWCFDDFAFGRCLPLYGRLLDQNLFRFDLKANELHDLEQEMQKLFLLGYRWSHSYTQCVLQLLLMAIKDKTPADLTACDAELNKDIEELSSLESEEVEEIDPRNLAIVRFRPSVVDPHSDYADELYYPPGNKVLLPFVIQEEEEAEPDIIPGYEKFDEPIQVEEIDYPLHDTFERRLEFLQPREELITTPDYPIDLDDYEPYVGEYLFEGPMKSEMPRKRAESAAGTPNNMEKPSTGLRFSRIFKKLLRRESMPDRNLNEIAKLLTNIRHGAVQDVEERDHITGETMYYPSKIKQSLNFDYEENRFDAPKDTFGKKITEVAVPTGHTPSAFKSKFQQITGYNPYLNHQEVNLKPENPTDLPELIPPKQETMYISDDIHPRYEPDSAKEEETRKEIKEKSEKEPHSRFFEKGISRFSEEGKPIKPVHTNPKPAVSESAEPSRWDINKMPLQDSAYEPPMDYSQHFDPRYTDPSFPISPPDYPLYVYYPPFYNYDYYDYTGAFAPPNAQQKDVKKDDEVPDYGGLMRNPNDPQRYDEKKPGPPFKQYQPNPNDNYEPEYLHGGGDWMRSMQNGWLPAGNPYPMMRPGAPFFEQNEGSFDNPMYPKDPVHVDEAALDGAINIGQKEGVPQSSSHVRPGMPSEEEQKDGQARKDSYVYLTINGEFRNDHDARQLVNMILHYAGIKKNRVQHISIKKNMLAFQLPENEQGITSAQLAEKIEELRSKILEKTHIEITQAGIGTKNEQSGVVYQADDRQMEAAAAIVCGVCGALLVSATILYLLRRQSKSKAKLHALTSHDTEASKDYQDLCRARMSTKEGSQTGSTTGPNAAAQRISSLSKESDNGNNSPSSRSSTSSWSEEPVVSNMDISTGHMVLSYMEDHLRNKDRLEQEWVDLCAYEAEPSTTNIASAESNTEKNRYKDAVPYDHNRVVINEHSNANGSNYINASSITDHDPRNPVYIATQGPLSSTASDFWQLVWEQGSVVIVMLSRLVENGKEMCHRYWPEEGSELYHIYEVHLVSEHIWCDDYLVRSFYLKNIRSGETRTVTQFHFLSWTESATPSSTKALLEFRRKVNKSYRGRSCPIIVHCSDGAGRTGTYCLIDMVLNRMVKGSKEIDIAATLEHIRDQRPQMVKTKSQFEFVLMAVAEEVHAILKALPQ